MLPPTHLAAHSLPLSTSNAWMNLLHCHQGKVPSTNAIYTCHRHFVYPYLYRYITRVVLIPFAAKGLSRLTPAERRLADKNMANAMEKASGGAPLIISLGVLLSSPQSVQELDLILDRLATLLPPNTKQWLFVSYGWLLLATLKVSRMVEGIIHT